MVRQGFLLVIIMLIFACKNDHTSNIKLKNDVIELYNHQKYIEAGKICRQMLLRKCFKIPGALPT